MRQPAVEEGDTHALAQRRWRHTPLLARPPARHSRYSSPSAPEGAASMLALRARRVVRRAAVAHTPSVMCFAMPAERLSESAPRPENVSVVCSFASDICLCVCQADETVSR